MIQPISFKAGAEKLPKINKNATKFVSEGTMIDYEAIRKSAEAFKNSVKKAENKLVEKQTAEINEAFQAKYAPYAAQKPVSEAEQSWVASHANITQ